MAKFGCGVRGGVGLLDAKGAKVARRTRKKIKKKIPKFLKHSLIVSSFMTFVNEQMLWN